MEAINEVLKTNLESKESDCRVCPKCGEPIERITYLPGFNRYIKGPVMCSCKKAEIKAKEIEEQNKEKQIRLNQIIKNSLMDENFKNSNFENWDFSKGNKKMYNLGKKYSNNFKELKEKSVGLLIYGNPGNGKTHTVSCIANALIDRMTPVICVSINALLDRIKETYGKWGTEGEETIIRSLSNADLLIIDDLGTEQNTDWSQTRIYNILDSRYRNKLPLIITTNITLEDLKEKYHARTYDRLLEMCTPVRNDGKSIRVDKATKDNGSLIKDMEEIQQQIAATNNQTNELELLNISLTEHEESIKNLVKQLSENSSSVAGKYIIEEIEKHEKEMNEIKDTLKTINETKSKKSEFNINIDLIINNLKTFYNTIDEADLDRKKFLISVLVDKITWNGSTGEVGIDLWGSPKKK